MRVRSLHLQPPVTRKSPKQLSIIRFALSSRLQGSILRCRLWPRTLHLSQRVGSVQTSRTLATDSNACSQPLPQRVDQDRTKHFDGGFQENPPEVGSKHIFGHYNAHFGEVISTANRRTTYRIERKLGQGFHSSVWLAREIQEDRFVALKILTTDATNAHNKGLSIEIEALALLEGHPNIIRALRNFTIPSKKTSAHPKEEHIVIATVLYSGSLYDILRVAGAAERFAPVRFVKHALLHVLRGLAHMHSRDYVHTDLKMDNILVDNGPLTETDIDSLLVADPPQWYRPQASELKPHPAKVAISQPLPVPTIEEAMSRAFCISDMGVTCWKGDLKAGMNMSPINLKAPEVILGAPLDEKVDIWIFGLLLYESVTGTMLFRRPVELESEAPGFPVAFHLWQMCALLSTVDNFPPYLRGGIYAEKYLNSDGLVSHPDLPKQQHGTLRRALNGNRPGLDPADGDALASILQRCLKLDPRERPGAAELLENPWWGLEGDP